MSKNRTTTTEMTPYEASQPLLDQIAGDAQSLYNQGGFEVTPYSGDRVAGFSDSTEAALSMMEGGSAVTPMSIDALGDILDPAKLDIIKSTVADDVKAQLGSTFSGGSIKSGLAQDTYTRAMTEAMAGTEFDARLSALSLAPSIAGMETQNMQQMLGAGVARDDLAQTQINSDMAAHYEQEDAGMQALRNYASIAQGVGGMGGTQTSTQPVSILGDLGGLASGIGGFWEAVF